MSAPWQVFVEYKRAQLTEVTKFGSIAWVMGSEVIHNYGSPSLFFPRSTAKPLHLKVFTKDLEKLSWEEKALSVASHNAETAHIEIVRKLLGKHSVDLLSVPRSQPLQGPLVQNPEKILHPCSGEHAALLRACENKNWSLENYTSLQHPLYKAYIAYVHSILGESWHPHYVAKDGCGLATVALNATELAQLFSNLVREKDKDWIWESMTRHPELVGGTGRLDTLIMRTGKGKILAKEGADGVLGLSIVHSDFPKGLGIAIKLAQGSDQQAMNFIVGAVLHCLDWKLPLPKLFRQEICINENIIPKELRGRLKDFQTRNLSDNLDDTF